MKNKTISKQKIQDLISTHEAFLKEHKETFKTLSQVNTYGEYNSQVYGEMMAIVEIETFIEDLKALLV